MEGSPSPAIADSATRTASLRPEPILGRIPIRAPENRAESEGASCAILHGAVTLARTRVRLRVMARHVQEIVLSPRAYWSTQDKIEVTTPHA